MAKKSIFDRFKKRANNNALVGLVDMDSWREILCTGYTRLIDSPEVRVCVDLIADLVSNMTIYLMENTEQGDKRIIDGLSRKIDINPAKGMTKKTWMYNIVHSMLLEGDGNAFVLPKYQRRDGAEYVADLEFMSPQYTTIIRNPDGFTVSYKGRQYDPANLLHFVQSPDPSYPTLGRGYRINLKTVADNLKQADATKSAFMSDKWRPSVIISVNGMTEEMSSDSGRDKILNKYISETNGGSKPWVIPDELVKVDQVKPLSLKDLALNEATEIDKKTVASVFGVPPFFVGVGEFKRDEYNTFIQTKILSIAMSIQQELTNKLIISPDRYFKFNYMSLMSYSLETLANVYGSWHDKGIVTGNEARDVLNMSPKDGLDDLVILENYIPADKVGEQSKLNE